MRAELSLQRSQTASRKAPSASRRSRGPKARCQGKTRSAGGTAGASRSRDTRSNLQAAQAPSLIPVPVTPRQRRHGGLHGRTCSWRTGHLVISALSITLDAQIVT